MLTRTRILALIAFAFSASAWAQYSQPVRDVENAGHFPFSANDLYVIPAGLDSHYGELLASVPAGKRVVLEYVAVTCLTAATDSITDFRLQIPRVINGSNATIPVPLFVSRQGEPASNLQRWVGGGPVKIYADYSTAFNIAYGFARSNSTIAANCAIYIFGHTINTP